MFFTQSRGGEHSRWPSGVSFSLSQQFLIVLAVPLHSTSSPQRHPLSLLSPVNAHVVYGLLTQPPLALRALYSLAGVRAARGIMSPWYCSFPGRHLEVCCVGVQGMCATRRLTFTLLYKYHPPRNTHLLHTFTQA